MWLVLATYAAIAAHPVSYIATDVGAGVLDTEDALWLTYLAHFEPEDLPERYRGDDPEGFLCATPLVDALTEHWWSFSAHQRERMTAHLAPWKDDLLDPVRERPGPPPPAGTDTCWGQYGPNRLLTEHFSVEWEDGVSQAYAEDFADALEYSYARELDKGWRPAEGMDRFLMLAYIVNGGGSSAYTTVQGCSEAYTYMPYIVAYEGSFGGGSVWYQDMAAHELNHAIQFGYTNDVYLAGYDGGWPLWYWEATAVWVQEEVYPTHNWWSPYIEGYTAQPWMSMEASDQQDPNEFWHLYGMAIYNFYLEEYVGDADLIRAHWEYVEDTRPRSDLDIAEVTADLGYDFGEVYAGWLAANTVMEYREAGYYPDVDIARRVTELPAEGEPRSSERPWSKGSNFIRIEGDLASEAKPDLHLSFEGDAGAEWMLLLVGTEGASVQEIVRVPVADAAADYVLEDFGRYDFWWLIPSPLADTQPMFDYAWRLEAQEPPGPPVPEWASEVGPLYLSVDGEPVDPEAEPWDGEEPVATCACAGGGPLPGWLPLLLAPLLLVRRRRRPSLRSPRPGGTHR